MKINNILAFLSKTLLNFLYDYGSLILFTFIFSLFSTFWFDGFKLSSIRSIRYLQIITFWICAFVFIWIIWLFIINDIKIIILIKYVLLFVGLIVAINIMANWLIKIKFLQNMPIYLWASINGVIIGVASYWILIVIQIIDKIWVI